MTRKASSFRLSRLILEQIDRLAEVTGMSKAMVIMIAVDRMYQQEFVEDNKKPAEIKQANQ